MRITYSNNQLYLALLHPLSQRRRMRWGGKRNARSKPGVRGRKREEGRSKGTKGVEGWRRRGEGPSSTWLRSSKSWAWKKLSSILNNEALVMSAALIAATSRISQRFLVTCQKPTYITRRKRNGGITCSRLQFANTVRNQKVERRCKHSLTTKCQHWTDHIRYTKYHRKIFKVSMKIVSKLCKFLLMNSDDSYQCITLHCALMTEFQFIWIAHSEWICKCFHTCILSISFLSFC